MVSIQIDEQTAKAIESAANAAGISISDFLKSLLPSVSPSHPVSSWDELEHEFTRLSIDGKLPESFSRSDIYSDHVG
jgi:hypothetical protein